MFINPKKVQAVLARCLIAGVALAVSPLLAASDKPNVVFMLSDNLGYGDLGFTAVGSFGAATPRIDALAAQGMRFTNFNVEASAHPRALR